jgi:hypothetical protein
LSEIDAKSTFGATGVSLPTVTGLFLFKKSIVDSVNLLKLTKTSVVGLVSIVFSIVLVSVGVVVFSDNIDFKLLREDKVWF